MTGDLAAAGHDNLQTAFASLAAHNPTGETRRFGPITAVASGIPVPMFNRVFAFEETPDDDLAAAVAWHRERALPFWVTVPSPVVDEVGHLAADLGLESGGAPQPGMALASLDDLPTNETAVDVAEVTDAHNIETFEAVSGRVFGLPEEVRHGIIPESTLTDDVLRSFLGRVGGDPVACGLLVRSADVAGVYTIALTRRSGTEGSARR